jgi:hypothetical protein
MRLEHCEKCPHLRASDAVCGRKGRPIAKIRGCSLSSAGKRFFRPVSGKEAYRLKFINRKGVET